MNFKILFFLINFKFFYSLQKIEEESISKEITPIIFFQWFTYSIKILLIIYIIYNVCLFSIDFFKNYKDEEPSIPKKNIKNNNKVDLTCKILEDKIDLENQNKKQIAFSSLNLKCNAEKLIEKYFHYIDEEKSLRLFLYFLKIFKQNENEFAKELQRNKENDLSITNIIIEIINAVINLKKNIGNKNKEIILKNKLFFIDKYFSLSFIKNDKEIIINKIKDCFSKEATTFQEFNLFFEDFNFMKFFIYFSRAISEFSIKKPELLEYQNFFQCKKKKVKTIKDFINYEGFQIFSHWQEINLKQQTQSENSIFPEMKLIKNEDLKKNIFINVKNLNLENLVQINQKIKDSPEYEHNLNIINNFYKNEKKKSTNPIETSRENIKKKKIIEMYQYYPIIDYFFLMVIKNI
jgi:hypothetical protein